ncbi:unnamed protein product [Linum trigynum]|uniref:Uncharacterized protein n=1 Tax=Linum trigynum TaxID=586398 RepID=A0AAV2G6C3_9ROSI
MKSMKKALRKLNREVYSDISEKVRQVEQQLMTLHQESLMHPDENSSRAKKAMQLQYDELRKQKDSFYWQKSRIGCLTRGDKCNKFFHQSLKVRNSKKAIRKLISEAGEELVDIELIADEAVSYYKNLFGVVNKNLL